MSLTVVVTRNAEGRVRGFLASCMLEIASSVYTSPNMSRAVRERIWEVLQKWNVGVRNDGAVMVWADSAAPGGLSISILGEPPTDLSETPSIVLARTPLSEAELCTLTIAVDGPPF